MNMGVDVRDRARGVLLAGAVGDALFGPAEFMTPEAIHHQWGGPLQQMVGGGWLKLRPGQVTDDTEMSLCLARALVRDREYRYQSVVANYQKWVKSGPVDIGGTVAGSLNLMRQGVQAGEAAHQVHIRQQGESAGNGSLMRIAPLGVLLRNDGAARARAARQDAALTHYDPLGGDCCVAYLDQLCQLLHGQWPDFVSADALMAEVMSEDEAKATTRVNRAPGFVVTALSVACVALRKAEQIGPEEALLWAGNLGGDTDTVAAISGGLLGAAYGTSWLQPWIDQLEPRQELQQLADALFDLGT